MAELTKEDIKTFIDLEKKIQDRIVELSKKFVGIPTYRIEECVGFKLPRFLDIITDSSDFISNSHEKEDIYFGVSRGEDHYMNFNKNILLFTDAEAEKVYQYNQECYREETEYKEHLARKKKYKGK